ncbi:MAG: CatB-related O-acetyltransferase [Bacteroidales bacterium]
MKFDVKISIGSSGGFNNIFEGGNVIGKNSEIRNSKLGYGTYISGQTKLNNVEIGRFCSIGQHVDNNFAQHPSAIWVSTHPSFFSTKKQAGFCFVTDQKFEEIKYCGKTSQTINIIGNDVWIGNYVKILPGLKIGDGAIIATGAVITKDVEPYTIVGGVPAKLIKYRFEKHQIQWLLSFKWWHKELVWIKSQAENFSDINNFIKTNS